MHDTLVLLIGVLFLVALAIASWDWGVDSRDGFGDGRVDRVNRSYPGHPRD